MNENSSSPGHERERRFLTALLREQNQSGCRGAAHDLLRRHAYPNSPLTGPGSLAFADEASPLTGLLLKEFSDLQQIDDFCRKEEKLADVVWPWSSGQEYRARLGEAQKEWVGTRTMSLNWLAAAEICWRLAVQEHSPGALR
jgi:hypothetical protein